MKKEAARISAAVMSVVVAVITALGYSLAPDQKEAITTVVTAVIQLGLVLGLGEWVRKNVFSQESHDSDVEMARNMAGEPQELQNPAGGPREEQP